MITQVSPAGGVAMAILASAPAGMMTSVLHGGVMLAAGAGVGAWVRSAPVPWLYSTLTGPEPPVTW